MTALGKRAGHIDIDDRMLDGFDPAVGRSALDRSGGLVAPGRGTLWLVEAAVSGRGVDRSGAGIVLVVAPDIPQLALYYMRITVP